MDASEVFTVDLPSKGVLYDGKLPEGKATLRPMGEAEENLLLQRGGDPMLKTQRIINNCYLDAEKVAPEDLLMADRFYILFMLRVQMFGPVYNIPFRCQGCNEQRTMPIDIMQDMEKKDMAEDASEPFEVKLPHCKNTVDFRLLRGKDEDEVSRHTKRTRMKSGEGDPSNRMRLGKHIIAVDSEELDEKGAQEFARSLDMCDANEFRLGVEDVEGGIDLTLFVDCDACGYTNEMVMPFTSEFLRPSTRVAG